MEGFSKMTLPHGFGSDKFRPPTEKPHKCKFGKFCSNGYASDKCSIHEWVYRHDEAWILLRILFGISITITFLVFAFYWHYEVGEPIRLIIEGCNCNQLAEYVANKLSWYDYAEHRYEWLCVNE